MRRSASLLDLRRRCAAARRGIRGVLPVLSSSSPVVDVTLGGALPPRRRRGRASRGGLRGGRRQPRAGRRRGAGGGAAASEGCCAPLLGLPPSTCGGVGRCALPPRHHRRQPLTGWALWHGSCTRSWPWGSPTSDASNADDPRPVLELPVGPQNAPFCSFRCRASERSMCGGWGGCEKARFGEVQFGAAASARRWRRRQCAKYFLCLIAPYSGGGRPLTRRLSCSEAI